MKYTELRITNQVANVERARDQHKIFLSQRHFGSLDAVRAICIVAVLWHHSGPDRGPGLLGRGFLGVDMFFVLSGFLIVTLLLREKSSTGRVSLPKFYMRRTLRIFPAYYGLLIMLTIVFGLIIPDAKTAPTFFASLPFYLTYTSNWTTIEAANLGPAWSLATEEQFYLAWPAIEKFVKAPALYAVLGLTIIVNQLINFGALDALFARLYGMDHPPRLPILDVTFTPIALGVVLAHLMQSPRGYAHVWRTVGQRRASVVIGILLLGVINFTPLELSGWPRLLIQTLMTAWIASLVVREDHSLRDLLGFKSFVWIGSISYGMYLYHLWAYHFARAVNDRLGFDHRFALFLTGSLITVVVATLSYQCYEMPFLAVKQRFAWKRPVE